MHYCFTHIKLLSIVNHNSYSLIYSLINVISNKEILNYYLLRISRSFVGSYYENKSIRYLSSLNICHKSLSQL